MDGPKCDYCDEPATINWELVWLKWTIDKEGNYSNKPFDTGQTVEAEFYCDACYKRHMAEELEKWEESILDDES